MLKRSLKAQADVEQRSVDAVLADATARIPARRLGRPEDILARVFTRNAETFLASLKRQQPLRMRPQDRPAFALTRSLRL